MILFYAHASQAALGRREQQEDNCLFARAVPNRLPGVGEASGQKQLAEEYEGSDPPTLVRQRGETTRRVGARLPARNGPAAPAPGSSAPGSSAKLHALASDPHSDAARGEAATELIAVLADGMGGHVAGGRASGLACRSFVDAYLQPGSSHRQRLTHALDAANRDIASAARSDTALEGMGCTLVAVVLGESGIRWISVGDSPLYMFRRGNLYQLNEDHSLAPVLDQMAERGEISRQEAQDHPRRHFLRSALTGGEIDIVDISDNELTLERDDWIVIASDGIETLTHTEIANVISRNRNAPPRAMAQALIDAVERAGDPHQDNTTVMAICPAFSEHADA